MKNQDSKQETCRTSSEDEASPFNSVKLELGFVIIFGIVLWLGIDFITPSIGKQLLLLLGYGLLSAIWLIFRTRRVLNSEQ